MDYKYHLAKRGKWICPECGKRTFVLYVDDQGEPLHETVGKCDRLLNCGYHNPPRNYLQTYQNVKMSQYKQQYRPQRKESREPSYVEPNRLKESMNDNDNNNLVRFLSSIFPVDDVTRMVNDYYIGTSSSRWPGATVFWRVDDRGHIRNGKVMQYDPSTGHRVKKPYDQVSWVHSILNIPDYNLTHCLFGEHLLNEAGVNDTIFLVESEKTSLLMRGMFYDCCCVATGGCEMFSEALCEPLKGRDLVVLPDNGWFVKWGEVARKLRYSCRSVKIVDLMERVAQNPGDDVGDLIVEAVRSDSYDIARMIVDSIVNSPRL